MNVLKKYLPSDIIRHMTKYKNPYEDLFNIVLRELQWKFCSEICSIVQLKLTSKSEIREHIVHIKEGNEITLVSLEKYYTGEYSTMTITKEEIIEFYLFQVYHLYRPYCKCDCSKNHESSYINKDGFYKDIPSLIANWEYDYYEYLDHLPSI